MPSQCEVHRESVNILRFLREHADSRGVVRASQRILAEIMGRPRLASTDRCTAWSTRSLLKCYQKVGAVS